MRYGISVKSDITIGTKRFECKEGTICLDMNVYKELKNYNFQSMAIMHFKNHYWNFKCFYLIHNSIKYLIALNTPLILFHSKFEGSLLLI